MSWEEEDWIGNITRFWHVQQENGICQSAQSMSLYFVCLWTLSAACFLILGSDQFRRRVACGSAPWWSTFGSLSLHVAVTLAIAALLRSPGAEMTTAASLGALMLAWFARPLFATPAWALCLLNTSDYYDAAIETQEMESIYIIGSLALYGIIWREAFHPPAEMKLALNASPVLNQALKMLRAGAVLGMFSVAFEVCLTLRRLCHEGTSWRRREHTNKTYRYCAITTSFCFGCTRTIASFLFWAGALQLGGEVFCPNTATLGKIVGLSVVLPFVDLLWRALLSKKSK